MDLVTQYEQDQHARIDALREPLADLLAYNEERVADADRWFGGSAWLAQLVRRDTREALLTAFAWYTDDLERVEAIAGQHGCGVVWLPLRDAPPRRTYWPAAPWRVKGCEMR